MNANTLIKALPLCCLFLAAANERECTIHIVNDGDNTGEGEGEGDAGEGEGDASSCETDADCGANQFCELVSNCPPCADGQDSPSCDIACTLSGTCVDIPPDACAAVDCGPGFTCVDENGQAFCEPTSGGCRADSDCGPNFFCDFSQCGGTGGGAPPPCDPSGANCGSDQPAPACDTGTCVEVQQPSCLNVLCADGFHCVEGDFGAQCVADGTQCQTDDECGPGDHCEVFCAADPNCPNCDSCLIEGECVQDACPALCGPGQECVINADGTAGCQDIRQPDCTSDADCNGGTCNASDVCAQDPSCTQSSGGGSAPIVACSDVCWGFCSDPAPVSCFQDSDCATGEICETTTTCPDCVNSDPACDIACTTDGKCVAADGSVPPQP